MLLYEARRSVDPAGADLLGVHLEREVDEVDDRQRPARCTVDAPTFSLDAAHARDDAKHAHEREVALALLAEPLVQRFLLGVEARLRVSRRWRGGV